MNPVRPLGALHNQLMRMMRGEAPLWMAWWAMGVPVAAFALWLAMLAEHYRYAEMHFTGALVDTFKLLLCLFWLIVAWRCSRNVEHRVWMTAGRGAIVATFIFVGLIY
jgi:hypothetical protein